MTSTITLYYKSKVNKDKNFILDNSGAKAIEYYLATLTQVSISNFQYVKHALSLSIKLNLSQEALELNNDSKDLNYVKIQNGSEKPIYYFVILKTWKSENTIELVLSMDTLNSFAFNTDYVINKKTLVRREHKDRFDSVVKAGKTPLATMRRYKRIIDLKSEEINPALYKVQEDNIYETEESVINWNLFYKNVLDPLAQTDAQINPVACYLLPDVPLPSKKLQTNNTISRTDITSGKYVLLLPAYNNNLTINVDGATYTPIKTINYHGTYFNDAVALYNDGTNFKIYKGYIRSSSGAQEWASWTLVSTNPTLVKVEHSNTQNYLYGYEVSSLPDGTTFFNNDYNDSSKINFTLSLNGTYVSVTLKSEQDIDRTDAKNIKLIALPYSPTPFSESLGTFYIDSAWVVNASLYLELANRNTRFINEFEAKNLLYSPMNELYVDKSRMIYYASIDERTDETDFIYESKLYHSDFYRPKFVYDSFSLNMDLEKVDGDTFWTQYHERVASPKLLVRFVTSRNIVSKFMFTLPQYILKDSVSDYDNVICVSRNNEKVLYNSQYLNYIRMGYNYDMKAKEKSETASGVGIALNTASLIASIGLSFIPGGQAIGVASAIGSGAGLVSQLVNHAKNVAQNEENIQRKLAEAQNQAVQVRNADDIDLLEEYSENKAKLCLYQMSSQMKKAMADLFYYCGYSCNEQKIPDVQTRKWFNYVQADLVIDESSNLTSEIEDDIREKFSNGVTFIHYKDSSFDLDQVTLNLEKWIYNIS